MNILCRLGWHAWERWSGYVLTSKTYDEGGYKTHYEPRQERSCKRCNIKQDRSIREEG